MSMSITRMMEQNVYYFLTSGLVHGIPAWTSVKVLPGFPATEEEISLPSVAITKTSFSDSDFELGCKNIQRNDRFVITLFCERDGQRDDLAERIKEIFDDTYMNFLDYNQGFSGGQDSLGIIKFEFINMNTIRDISSPSKALNHRMDILINAEFVYELSI